MADDQEQPVAEDQKHAALARGLALTLHPSFHCLAVLRSTPSVTHRELPALDRHPRHGVEQHQPDRPHCHELRVTHHHSLSPGTGRNRR